MFADDKAVITKSEDDLQPALHILNTISMDYNFKICTAITKVMEYQENEHIRTKILTDNKVNEQIQEFNYLGCSIPHINNNMYNQLRRFQDICGTIQQTFKTSK